MFEELNVLKAVKGQC